MPPPGPSKQQQQQLVQQQQLALEEKEGLLAYYRARVDEFEKERESLLLSVDRASIQSVDLHRSDFENRKRAGEIRELQKALSDAHAFLFEERQRLLTLQAENDELRLAEIEDRKRIQQLLSRDPPGSAAQQRMGNYSADALMLKVEALQAQLSEQKQLASERIAALMEDRRIREHEAAAHVAALDAQVEGKETRLVHTEDQLRQATKEGILARRDKQAAEEAAAIADAALQEGRRQAAEALSAAKRKADVGMREAKQLGEAKLEDVAGHLRKQLRAREDEVASLTSVHVALKAQYEERLSELEAKCARLSAANKQLDVRRHQDMEGFSQDVTHLRQMLTAVDRKLHEMRLVERIEDDDRLDHILEHLRRTRPALPEPPRRSAPDGGDDVRSVKGELAGGLRDVRGSVKGLEERLQAKRKALALRPT